MGIRVTSSKTKSFSRDESGALLVFFGLCCAALFLVAALSFDVGRRASTQTELQSFTDNVALAAAGELNGFPGARARAREAANSLIRDSVVFGADDQERELGSATDYNIAFYESLPVDDTMPLIDPILDSDLLGDQKARYVHITLGGEGDDDKRVTVDWVFAKILTVFSTNSAFLEETKIGADSVAGFTSYACDVAPVFFCLPDPVSSKGDGDIWDPENHIGEQILVRTGGKNAAWGPGNFGWLDVEDTIAQAGEVVDPDGVCDDLSGPQLTACLISAAEAVTLCFKNGLLVTDPGQKEGIYPAILNGRFDIYDKTQNKNDEDERFQPAPLVTKGFYDKNGDICTGNAVDDIPTDAYPLDDCFGGSGTATCQAYPEGATDAEVRYGDGDWSEGRLDYVDANFSKNYDTLGNVVDDPTSPDYELDADGYHIDDPFSPSNAATNGFKALPLGASRWEYYIAEYTATYFDKPAEAYDTYMARGAFDEFTLPGTPKAAESLLVPMQSFVSDNGTPEDPSDDIYDTINRLEDSLPKCAPANGGGFSMDPRRRTIIAAVVDCSSTGVNGPKISGKTTDVTAQYFIEMFMSRPIKDVPSGGGKFDMFLEVIGPALNGGDDSIAPGKFRNLVQLYR